MSAHPDGLHAAVGRQEKQIQRIQIQVLKDLFDTASNIIVVTYLHASSMLSSTRHKVLQLDKTQRIDSPYHLHRQDAKWPSFLFVTGALAAALTKTSRTPFCSFPNHAA